MRVAAYCRVSTSQEKNMRSLENQIRYYRETIVRREGWDLVGIYTDVDTPYGQNPKSP